MIYAHQKSTSSFEKLMADITGENANVMIEVRNDLIDTPDAQSDAAHQLLALLRPALASLEVMNA